MLRSIWYVAIRGSVFLRRTSFAAMPMPIRSSELKRSSASCGVRLIASSLTQSREFRLNQEDRVTRTYDSLAQHRAIHAGAAAVFARDMLEDLGRGLGGFRIEPNHHAPRILLHHLQRHFGSDQQFSPDELVFEGELRILPFNVKILPKPSSVQVDSDLLRQG